MTQRTLTKDSTVVAKSNQSSADLGVETAILDLETGIYYSVDRIGKRIWDLLQEPTTVARIRDELVGQFDVSPETCERDVTTFLERLVGAGLVDVVENDATS